MSKGRVEEFALDGAGSPGGDDASGPGSSGQGPVGPEERPRRSPGWRHRPGIWAALAVVLVVVGAAVSPQGEPLEPRPPDTAWSAATNPGRAPGVWVLGDRPVVTAADGLTALDPESGEPAWTVPLDDPACTATEQVLTCVHGAGETASIATIEATGEVTEQPFQDADVAVSLGDDVIVAGGTATDRQWLGRYTTTGEDPPTEVWQYQPDHTADRRWQEAVLSQAIVTLGTGPENTEGGPSPSWAGFSLAVDVETGEPRPAVVHSFQGTVTSTGPDVTDRWRQIVLPMAGPEPAVPGYPEAVFTGSGVFDSFDGDRILAYVGTPLAAAGDDLVLASLLPDAMTLPEEGAEVAIAMQVERVDVRTGESRWQLDRDGFLSCPCATSHDTIVVTAAEIPDTDVGGLSPAGLLGIDSDTGRHHWTLPISTAPDEIAAGSNHVYLLTPGTLTAYENR